HHVVGSRVGRRREALLGQDVEVHAGRHRHQRLLDVGTVGQRGTDLHELYRVAVEPSPYFDVPHAAVPAEAGVGGTAESMSSASRSCVIASATRTPCSRPAPEQWPTASRLPAARGRAVSLEAIASSSSANCGMHSPRAAWRSKATDTVVVASGAAPATAAASTDVAG